MDSWRKTLRISWSGDGWIIWLSAAGSLLCWPLGWFAAQLALLAIELVAIGSVTTRMTRIRVSRIRWGIKITTEPRWIQRGR